MKLRRTLAAVLLAAVVPVAAACGTTVEAATAGSTVSSDSSSTDSGTSGSSTTDGGPGGGGPGGIDVASVTTEAQLVELVQEAYGDAGLGLHRGHQPVEDVLDEVLAISHDELHVRMDAGQNLAAVAEDVGVDPQDLVDALVAEYGPAIDTLLADGTITEDEAEQYRAALEEAFTFRVTWDGEQATPTFSGLDA
ncbi:hypothetical protein SAMN04488107_2194 [Geodermatophilus saharensis]|uniref:SurA N-terminal domain-containing protein n=1 Tax=Geodermatophilus saharensis TaxID=1137994 RepID=A0A239DJF2_9ACTN|nr:hypothetical protein [Geodermatophilus saharensis]SNS32131.1 hypothetical protein SAMN04488107_2194 [Geodermatophilus saharensis]